MSNIQKYIKRKYNPGGLMMPQMDYGLNFLPPEPGSFNLGMPQNQQIGGFNMGNYDIQTKSKFGQMLSNFGGQFSGQNVKTGFQDLTGGQGFGELFQGAMKGEGPGAGLLGSIAQGVGSGGGLDVQGVLGKAVSGGGFDPFSIAGGALDTLADDKDATTYKVGEIGADVAGVGMGVGRILTGDVLGGGKQLLGEIADIGKSIFGRKKARREQKSAEKKAKRDYFEREGELAEQRVAESVMSGQMSRSGEAAGSLTAMQEKYSQAGAQTRGTLEEGGKIKFENGGDPLLAMLKSGQLTANTPMSDAQREAIKPDLSKQRSFGMTDEQVEKARLGLDVAGMVNPLAGFAAGALDAKDALQYWKEGEFGDAAKSAGLATLGFIPWGGSWVKGGIKGVKALSKTPIKPMIEGVSKTTAKTFLKGAGKGDKYKEKIQEFVENIKRKPGADKTPTTFAGLSKGGKISFDVNDYYSGGYMKYVKGGITPGEFSHKGNPLTVIDKQGNDTGMELTGGEGVFDQSAMTMLDKYKKTKNYSKAGKLVFKEMNSWKDAGTAKYGTRIKEY